MARVPARPNPFFRVGPAAATAQSYAIKRGKIEQRLSAEYYQAEFREFFQVLHQQIPESKPLSAFGDVICGPFGSSVKLSDYVDDGVPLLRISNISDNGELNTDNMVFITHEQSDELASTRVREGDLVVSQRGTLGMPAVVSSEYPFFNISANLIAVQNLSGVHPKFVQFYLASKLGTIQVTRLQSGQVQPKITTDDIASILIPSVANQAELIFSMDAARAERKAKLAEADVLLAGVDDYVLDALATRGHKKTRGGSMQSTLPKCRRKSGSTPSITTQNELRLCVY